MLMKANGVSRKVSNSITKLDLQNKNKVLGLEYKNIQMNCNVCMHATKHVWFYHHDPTIVFFHISL